MIAVYLRYDMTLQNFLLQRLFSHDFALTSCAIQLLKARTRRASTTAAAGAATARRVLENAGNHVFIHEQLPMASQP